MAIAKSTDNLLKNSPGFFFTTFAFFHWNDIFIMKLIQVSLEHIMTVWVHFTRGVQSPSTSIHMHNECSLQSKV